MKLPKLPEGYSYGYLFSYAKGRQLDIFGEREGIKRKKWLFFKEPDSWYKRRIAERALEKIQMR